MLGMDSIDKHRCFESSYNIDEVAEQRQVYLFNPNIWHPESSREGGVLRSRASFSLDLGKAKHRGWGQNSSHTQNVPDSVV